MSQAGGLGRLSFCVLLVSQMMATVGFTFVMPFTPLYIQELGVTDPGDAAAWAGFVNGSSGLTMALAAPLWGRLADRMGRKVMLLRATLAAAVVVGLMGFVTSPWQLLALRLAQGTLTGTVPAATALVAANSPFEKVGSRLGTLQMIIFLAAAAGPFAGGMFADLVGLRASFYLTAGLLATSGVMILLGIREGRRSPKAATEEAAKEETSAEAEAPSGLPYRRMLPGLVALFMAHIAITCVAVNLPGFLASLEGDTYNVASRVGQIMGTGALAAALGSALAGRLAARFGAGTLVIWALAFAGLATVPQTWVTSVADLWALRLGTSLFLGGVIPAANLFIKDVVPETRQGAAFGVASSAVALGFAVGPVGGGLITAAFGFETAFLIPGLLLTGSGAALWAVSHKKIPSTRRLKTLWKVATGHLVR